MDNLPSTWISGLSTIRPALGRSRGTHCRCCHRANVVKMSCKRITSDTFCQCPSHHQRRPSEVTKRHILPADSSPHFIFISPWLIFYWSNPPRACNAPPPAVCFASLRHSTPIERLHAACPSSRGRRSQKMDLRRCITETFNAAAVAADGDSFHIRRVVFPLE